MHSCVCVLIPGQTLCTDAVFKEGRRCQCSPGPCPQGPGLGSGGGGKEVQQELGPGSASFLAPTAGVSATGLTPCLQPGPNNDALTIQICY